MQPREFFGVYDGALDPQFCRSVIERFEAYPRKVPGKVGDHTPEGGVRPEIKDTVEVLLTQEHPEWRDVLAHVTDNLRRILPVYLERWHPAFTVPLRPEDFRVARYLPGGHFDWHSDNMGGSVTRVITAQWFLNDVLEGGETEFAWQGVAVPPREGRLLLAPVGWTYLHRGAPPVSGPKYIIITQLHQVLDPA